MKCCDISAGMLREKIVIERNTPASDGEGGFTDAWAADPAGGVWAHIRASGGGLERFFAERVTPGNRYKAIIRFRGDGNGAPYYTIADRVQYKGRELAIESVIDVDQQERYLELELLENKAS